MTAFVIGNGLSRKGIDLTKLDGMTYGCNWLYKDFKPDVLVATDTPISTHIQCSGYPKYHKFYTRKSYANTGAMTLMTQYKNWASGPNAVQLAVLDYHKTIILLGFDFGGSMPTFNNMYSGTKFYKKSDTQSTYAGTWKSQISKIFSMARGLQFKIVEGKETCKSIHEFNKFNNVEIITLSSFCETYVDN